ncbi:hypothetical protein M9458_040849, partial [Cirrhinus mrigala]
DPLKPLAIAGFKARDKRSCVLCEGVWEMPRCQEAKMPRYQDGLGSREIPGIPMCTPEITTLTNDEEYEHRLGGPILHFCTRTVVLIK